MLKTGIPLEGALRQLCETMRRGRLRTELELLQADLAKGAPLREAVAARKLPELLRAHGPGGPAGQRPARHVDPAGRLLSPPERYRGAAERADGLSGDRSGHDHRALCFPDLAIRNADRDVHARVFGEQQDALRIAGQYLAAGDLALPS